MLTVRMIQDHVHWITHANIMEHASTKALIMTATAWKVLPERIVAMILDLVQMETLAKTMVPASIRELPSNVPALRVLLEPIVKKI